MSSLKTIHGEPVKNLSTAIIVSPQKAEKLIKLKKQGSKYMPGGYSFINVDKILEGKD